MTLEISLLFVLALIAVVTHSLGNKQNVINAVRNA